MENFRTHHRKPRAGAMDGFLRPQAPPQQLPRPQLHFGRPAHGGRNLQARGARIDNFGRPDGMHARSRPQAAPTATGMSQAAPATIQQRTPRGKSHMIAMNLKPDRKGKSKAKKKLGWKKIALRSSGGVLILVLMITGFLFAKGYLKAKQVFDGDGPVAPSLNKEITPALLRGEGDGRVNFLMLGKGGPSHEGGELTDTLLIASIDPIQKDAALLSIPRDLWVTVNGYGSMKVNAVYNSGKENAAARGERDKKKQEDAGIDLVSKTISDTIGLPIHYHSVVDFDAFLQGIDAVGGIDVNVKTPVHDSNFAWQFGVLDVKAGMQHFDGKTALMYARSRYTSERGDFDRTERQREIMVALKSKILSLNTFSNPMKVSGLLDAFGDHVTTDLRLEEMKRLYDIGKDIDSSDITSLGLADPPNNFVTTDTINGQSVVVPRAGVGNFKEIQTFVRTTLRDSFLKKENATVAVFNGTTITGLAGKKTDELKSFGYNVVKTETAPTQTYEQTTLIDLTKGAKKFTRSYLEKRFNVVAGEALPDPNIAAEGVDFVIILGKNAETSN